MNDYPPDRNPDLAKALTHEAEVPAVLSPAETRLLVVDDDRDSADALSMVLEGYGYTVAVAYRYAEALSQFKTFKPAVALFDLSAPEPNGLELARTIRQSDAVTILLAFTGYALEEDVKATEQAGFNRHFAKPVDPTSIRQYIEALCLPNPRA